MVFNNYSAMLQLISKIFSSLNIFLNSFKDSQKKVKKKPLPLERLFNAKNQHLFIGFNRRIDQVNLLMNGRAGRVSFQNRHLFRETLAKNLSNHHFRLRIIPDLPFYLR